MDQHHKPLALERELTRQGPPTTSSTRQFVALRAPTMRQNGAPDPRVKGLASLRIIAPPIADSRGCSMQPPAGASSLTPARVCARASPAALRLGPDDVVSNSVDLSPCRIDSGTTFTYVPKRALGSLEAAIKALAPLTASLLYIELQL